MHQWRENGARTEREGERASREKRNCGAVSQSSLLTSQIEIYSVQSNATVTRVMTNAAPTRLLRCIKLSTHCAPPDVDSGAACTGARFAESVREGEVERPYELQRTPSPDR